MTDTSNISSGGHTPTPWTATPGTFFVCQIGSNPDDPCIWSEAYPPDGNPFPFGEKAADRDFIVTAVNSHADLLAALEAARPVIAQEAQGFDSEYSERMELILAQIDAALIKAKGSAS